MHLALVLPSPWPGMVLLDQDTITPSMQGRCRIRLTSTRGGVVGGGRPVRGGVGTGPSLGGQMFEFVG